MMTTDSMENAKRLIGERVELFARNREQYRHPEYKEAQLRSEFLDPFFAALGWDVSNAQGWSEQYKEVVNEDALKIGGATRAPDYSFRIGGVRKFFAEAKKPALLIKTDASAAYQLRRYAWSAKLPLSVLTDFEELAVYDCRARPSDKDKANLGRINFFTFDQYLDRLPEIYDVFSKEAVLRGSFDRYAQETKSKRGTTPVDAEFLKEIEGWRATLAKNIATNNPRLTLDELNDAVQRTIDRIIFLRMAEDRGAEEYGRLSVIASREAAKQSPNRGSEIASSQSFDSAALRTGPLLATLAPHASAGVTNVYARLLNLCRDADTKYNSGLFDFSTDTLTPNLKIDDDKLSGILADLYYPQSPYEFSVLAADTLGNVYEQFLGKVIRLTPTHQAKIEEKPEVKKAGGVYYTPTYIVDYIVKQTVGKLIEGKSPPEIERLRVLDPACGSGSFLLGAYQLLLDHHLNWYAANRDQKAAQNRIYESTTGWRLTTAEKKRILLNNIYGVDIDRQAVEVTKLSLLLKVLEDENQETLGKQLALFKERALPNLDANIRCGNSLIGTDYFAGQLMPDQDEYRRVNPFDWKTAFPQIFNHEGTKDTKGFDVVIGNPPWGADFSLLEQKCIRENYAVGRNSNLDSYAIFMERAIKLLKQNGILGYITPDTFLRKDDHLATRRFLFEENTLEELIETGPLFSAVRDTWCLILTIIKGKPPVEHRTRHRKISRFVVSVEERLEKFGKGAWDSEDQVRQSVWMQRPNLIVGYRAAEAEQRIIAKIETWQRLGDLSNRFTISRGEEGSKFALVEKASGKFFMVIPQDVERFHVEKGIRVSTESLTQTKVKGFYRRPKIWIIRIQKLRWRQRIVCAFDERTNSAGMKTLQVIISPTDNTEDLKYLSALLASKLMNFWCTNYLADDINQSYLERIPIRTIDLNNANDAERHRRIIALVEQMLTLHKQLSAAQTAADREMHQRLIDATGAQIDALVYALYGLTEEEISVVEGK